jgi:hypothetical protein
VIGSLPALVRATRKRIETLAKSGPGNCSVCSSKFRASVDLGLVRGLSFRALASRFGLHADAIGRHSENHLSVVMRAALLTAVQPTAIDLDKLHEQEGSNLLANIAAQRGRLQVFAEAAADAGDTRAAVSAEAGITSNLALTAKILGAIVQRMDVRHHSILISPEYTTLRSTLIAALAPFPAAQLAVSRALHQLEANAAVDITAAASKGRARPEPVLIEHEPAPAATPPPPADAPAALPPPPY